MPQPLCFLSRVITLLTRDIHTANLSVRYVPVSDENGLAYRQSFYRATRMHSADYAVARCLSVCHTPVLCLNGYTYLQSFFTIG